MGEGNLMKYDNEGKITLNIYVSEKEINLILEELYMYDDLEEFQDRLRKTFQSCENELWRRDSEIHQR